MAREGCRLRKDVSRPYVSPSGWSPAQETATTNSKHQEMRRI